MKTRLIGITMLLLAILAVSGVLYAQGVLQPGDSIDGMSLRSGGSQGPPIWAFCASAFPNPGVTTTECTVPPLPELAIGHGCFFADEPLREAGWPLHHWEMYLDGQQIDLDTAAYFAIADRDDLDYAEKLARYRKLADTYFEEGGIANYVLAVSSYREFLTLYPQHPKSDYAQFRAAESYFKQRNSPDRDQTATEQALERGALRDNITKEEIQERLNNQISLNEKIKRADYVIDNSGGLENTRRQVVEIWNTLKNSTRRE